MFLVTKFVMYILFKALNFKLLPLNIRQCIHDSRRLLPNKQLSSLFLALLTSDVEILMNHFLGKIFRNIEHQKCVKH